MSEAWEIATIRSRAEVVLHLDGMPEDPVTSAWLDDKLGISTWQLFMDLEREDNLGFLAALYQTKYIDWGGILRVPKGESSEDLVLETMPPTCTAENRLDCREILYVGAGHHNDAARHWPLPALDLVVHNTAALREGINSLVHCENEAHVCAAPVPFRFPRRDVQRLQEAVTTLQDQIKKREVRWATQYEYVHALRRVDDVLRLQSRAWSAWTPHYPKSADAIARLSQLRVATNELASKAAREINALEETVAADVLQLFSVPSLRDTAEKLAFDRHSLAADEREMFEAALNTAVVTLARSGRAQPFLVEHGLPALEAGCERTPYGFQSLVAEVENAALRHEIEVGWRDTIRDLKGGMGSSSKESLLVPLASASTIYRGSILTNLMSPGTFAAMWNAWRSNRVEPDIQQMLGLLMRKLATTGVPTPTRGLAVGPKMDFRWLAKQLDHMRDAHGPGGVQRQIKILEGLRLDRQVLRTPAALGFNWTLALMMMLAGLSGESEDAASNALAAAAGVGGLLAAGAHTAEFVAARSGATRELVNVYGDADEILGRLAFVFATVLTARTLSRKLEDPSLGSVAPEVLSLAGSTLTGAGWIFASVSSVGWAPLLASSLSIVGTLAGFAAFVWGLATTPEPEAGTYTLMRHYLDYSSRGEAVAAHGYELRQLAGELTSAEHEWIFTNFGRNVGAVGVSDPNSPPTFHAAYQMGFNAEEIATMFSSANVDDVVKAGIPKHFRGSRPPARP